MDAGDEFGRYRLDRLIGRGGMGEVWEAFHQDHQRRVAVKVLPAHLVDDDEFQRRFRREARLAARLRDPHVVPIHDFGELDGQLYLEMRLIEGEDLEQILAREGPLSPERAVAIVGQVASALSAAHREGMVHRDVKPSNVLIDRAGGGEEFAYLADFGISRSVVDSRGSTSSGGVVGTLEYMAPEQFEGRPTTQSDVYSLACLLYRCLTGSVPYQGGGLPGLMHAHLTTDPPAPSENATGVPRSLDPVVRRGLAKDPDDRPAGAADFTTSAREALGGSSVRDSPSGTTSAAPGSVDPPGAPGATTVEPTVAEAGAEEPTVAEPAADEPATDASTLERTEPPPEPPPGPPPSDSTDAPRRGFLPRGRRARIVATAAVVVVVIVGVGLVVILGGGAGLSAGSVDRPRVAATIRVPNGPETLAFSLDGSRAYVTGSVGASVLHVLDTRSGAVIGTVPLPGVPRFVAVSPRDGQVFVSLNDLTSNALVVASVDPTTGTVTRIIPTGQAVDRVTGQTWLFTFAVSSDGTRLYVPHHNAAVVSVIDTVSGTPIAQVPVPRSPHGVSLTPDGRFAYIAIHEAAAVAVLDTATNAVATTIPLVPGSAPHSLATAPDGRDVAVVNFDGNSLTMIDTATNMVSSSYPVGSNPQSLAYARDGAHTYTVNNSSGTVSTINVATRAVTAVTSVGAGASMVAVSPDGRHALVASRDSATVTSLDLDG